MKIEIHKTFGTGWGDYRSNKGYQVWVFDRVWLLGYALVLLIEAVVLLGSLTLVQLTLVDGYKKQMGKRHNRREKRRLARHTVEQARVAGKEAAKNGDPSFVNPYYAVKPDLCEAWDDGYGLDWFQE